ncbi:MAG: DNA mismatch repair protein MutS [Planctomycetaceae bacterium]|nr:DNA mismatch repair protein MutS [Planctomycetaceae bacterium]
MAKTPMMQQYEDAKQACGDAILLFRMGDFYELFDEDAKLAARTLGLSLTSRDKGENPIPMAGFPHHQLDGYLAKLIHAGFRAAVCEQVEDAKKAKGLVKREITRVVSPGTLTDDALLNPQEHNYLAAVSWGATPKPPKSNNGLKVLNTPEPRVGLAWAELSTGLFFAADFPQDELVDQLARINPSECLIREDADETLMTHPPRGTMVTPRPSWSFSRDAAASALAKQFGTHSLDGMGFTDDDGLAVQAAGAVLEYLRETQKTSLDHIQRLTPYRNSEILEIDEATRRSLEITRTIRDGQREGSLLSVLDHTVTAMGSRLLTDWLANPLTDIKVIRQRQEAVQELLQEDQLRETLQTCLKNIYDMERLLARVSTGRSSPRDLSFIGKTLEQLPLIKSNLQNRSSNQLQELEQELDVCEDLKVLLASALVENCPLQIRDGGIIQVGFHAELDRLRKLSDGGKQWIANYQAKEAEKTGLPNLKIGFNKVFGYYLELTNAHKDKAPDYFIRKQTLKNAERYITPELKEHEEEVLRSAEQALELECQVFLELRDTIHQEATRLQNTARVLGQLDVLASLAELAEQRNYCRPTMVTEPVLDILDGKHPVLDVTEPEGTFVPNDTCAGTGEQLVLLITGPNMAGKSTYIRQVALITLMAQIGSFVPAQTATIGIADRIFARVGASDELSRGQSTFMVEMTETARILNTATQHSLVILDEIGRGTSTYDGVSLAWAIMEHIHNHIGCRTLFATHYHELTELEGTLSSVKNLNVDVKEWHDNVVFLHKIVAGAANKSYGIHVARLAGVPQEVNHRAQQILAQLEADPRSLSDTPSLALPDTSGPNRDLQLTLFNPVEHPLLDTIRGTEINELTPLQALQLLQSWKDQLGDNTSDPE